MKLISMLAVATAIGGVAAAPAFAQDTPAPAPAPVEPEKPHTSGFYVGGGINLYFLDRDAAAGGMPIVFEDQPSPGAFMARLGYAFNENFAVEVEAGIGGARSQFTTSGGGADGEIGIETPVGAHLVVSMPLNGDGYIMGKAGYVTAKVSREYLGFDYEDIDINGPTFGVGAGLRSGPWDYRFEYSFMSGGDSGDGGVLGMFVMHHF
jgi:opacity protein-like surface antigen